MKHIWIWNSADGPILFSSRTKGVAYVNNLWPEGKWLKGDDVWEFWAPDDWTSYEPTARLCKETVH